FVFSLSHPTKFALMIHAPAIAAFADHVTDAVDVVDDLVALADSCAAVLAADIAPATAVALVAVPDHDLFAVFAAVYSRFAAVYSAILALIAANSALIALVPLLYYFIVYAVVVSLPKKDSPYLLAVRTIVDVAVASAAIAALGSVALVVAVAAR